MQNAESARRQARWLLWQAGGVTVDAPEGMEAFEPEGRTEGIAPASLPEAPLRRGRYESVIRRMKQAGQRTGVYTSWGNT